MATVWMINREQLWTGYFTIEKGIYEQILTNPAEVGFRHCKRGGRQVPDRGPDHDRFPGWHQ